MQTNLDLTNKFEQSTLSQVGRLLVMMTMGSWSCLFTLAVSLVLINSVTGSTGLNMEHDVVNCLIMILRHTLFSLHWGRGYTSICWGHGAPSAGTAHPGWGPEDTLLEVCLPESLTEDCFSQEGFLHSRDRQEPCVYCAIFPLYLSCLKYLE